MSQTTSKASIGNFLQICRCHIIMAITPSRVRVIIFRSKNVNNQIGDSLSLKTNPKRFWSFIKANKRENIGIPILRVNENPITNDRDKGNTLNNQFTSVFTSERYPIPVIPSLYSSISSVLPRIEKGHGAA